MAIVNPALHALEMRRYGEYISYRCKTCPDHPALCVEPCFENYQVRRQARPRQRADPQQQADDDDDDDDDDDN